MWKKLQIIKINIPKYEHNGFTVNTSKNLISNISRTFTYKVPFKMKNIDNLYSFELYFNKNYLIIYFYINLNQIENLIINNKIIPYKNNLFTILKQFNNNSYESVIKYRETCSLTKLLDNIEIFSNYDEYTLSFDNLIFDVEKEDIHIKNSSNYKILTLDIYYFFTKTDSFTLLNNIQDKKKICIIDDLCYYNNKNVMNNENYIFYNKKILNNLDHIIIDKSFFLSSKYVKNYKIFHSNSNSIHAYNNYKKFITNQDDNYNVYNLELLDNYIFIFRNIDLLELYNHPLLYSNSRKIFLFNNINEIEIENCRNFSLCYNKKKYMRDKIHKIYNKSYYIESNMYQLLDKYVYKNDIQFNHLDFNVNTIFKIIYFPINETCYINYRKIGFNCNVMLDCKHRFISNDIDLFINKHNSCPICEKKTENIILYINPTTIIGDLFGKEFEEIYNENLHLKHIIIHHYTTNFKNLITKMYKNIEFYENLENINIQDKSIIYTSKDIKYSLLNSYNINSCNINKIYSLI